MSDSRKICDVDFEGLGKTLSRIKDDEVKKLIKDLMDEIKNRKEAFDEKSLDQVEYYSRIYELLKISENKLLKEMATDSYSENLAKSIIDRFREYIAQFSPVLHEKSEVKNDSSCYTLSEQQAWLSDDAIKQHFEDALTEINKRTYFDKSVYISHAFCQSHGGGIDQTNQSLNWVFSFLESLKKHLKHAGFMFDMLPDDHYNGSIFNYMENITKNKYVFLIGTPMLLKKHNEGACPVFTTELNLIRRKRKLSHLNQDNIVRLLISDNEEQSYPIEFSLYKSFTNWVPSQASKTYFQNLQGLLSMMFKDDFKYDFSLMSTLPKNDKSNARKGRIYLSSDGQYVLRNMKGIVHEGSFDKNLITGNLSNNLKDDRFLRQILDTTSNAGHTHKGDDMFSDIWDAFLKKIPADKAKRLTSPPIRNLIVNPTEMKTTLSNTSPVDSNVLILKKLDQLQVDQSKLLTLVQDDSKKHQENTQAILNKIDEAKDELIRKVEEIDSIIHQLSKSKVVSPVLSKSLERESSLTSKSLHFNARFKGLFGDFLSIAKHVAENKIPPDQKNVEVATSVFDKLMSLIPLPYMGLIANLLTSSIKYVDRSIQKSDAKKTNQALGEDVDVIAELAFKITSNYQRQIEKLSDKGIETLAECARKRVVHFILSLDEHKIQSYCSFQPADKVEFLFLGIAKGKSSIKLHNHLETSNQKDDRKWTDDGLFLRSGWELPDRTQYICYADQQNKDNAVNKIKKYGFHLATLADKSFFEAHHFKFMLFAGSQSPAAPPPIDRSSKPKGLLANVNGSG